MELKQQTKLEKKAKFKILLKMSDDETSREKAQNLIKLLYDLGHCNNEEIVNCRRKNCSDIPYRYGYCCTHLSEKSTYEYINTTINSLSHDYNKLIDIEKEFMKTAFNGYISEIKTKIKTCRQNRWLISSKLITQCIQSYADIARNNSYENIFNDRYNYINKLDNKLISSINAEVDINIKVEYINKLFDKSNLELIKNINNTYHEQVLTKYNEIEECPLSIALVEEMNNYSKYSYELRKYNQSSRDLEESKTYLLKQLYKSESNDLISHTKNLSVFESIIYNELHKLKNKYTICFGEQKSFVDLKNKKPLRYDIFGFLYMSKGFLAPFVIEVDDKAHFIKKNNVHDIYKNYYCWINGFCLLRIDMEYNKKNDVTYDTIIKSFFDDIINKKRLIHKYIGNSYFNNS